MPYKIACITKDYQLIYKLALFLMDHLETWGKYLLNFHVYKSSANSIRKVSEQ